MSNDPYILKKNILNIIFLLIPISLTIGPLIAEITFNIFTIIILHEIFKYKKIEIFKEKIFIFFYIFYSITLLSAILYQNSFLIVKFFFYFRLILFLICAKYFFDQKYFNYKYINFLFIFFLIIIIDAIAQIISGTSLLGNSGQYSEGFTFNISGIFFSEEILGSYLSRLLPVISFFSYIKYKNYLANNFNVIFYILCFFIILFTGERVAIIIMLLNILLILAIGKNFRNVTILLLLLPIVLFGSFKYESKIFNRLIDTTYTQIFENNKFNWISEAHSKHLISSYHIFKDNKFLGAGPRSFRIECKKYNHIVKGCSTHPHNNYAQILAETGILGFSIFIFGIYFIYKSFIKYFYYYFKKKRFEYIYLVLPLGALVFQFIPILPTGNFFNNWLSIIYFYTLSLIFFKREKIN